MGTPLHKQFLQVFFAMGFTVGCVPYFFPLAGWIYWGIMLVNFSKFPAVVLLCIGWDFIYDRAAPESMKIAFEEMAYDWTQAFAMCCLAWMRWPSFVAAMYALTT